MNADDDGFCEHFTIMRMTDSKPDDLKILQAKCFINVFDDKVLVITDWKENNYLRSDRYTPSKYLEIYKKELKLLVENNVYTNGIPNGNQMATQVRLGKDRLGKGTTSDESQVKKTKYNPLGEEVLKAFEKIDPKNKTYYGNTTQRKACDHLLSEYGLEEILKRISVLPKTNKIPYFPKINCPYDLKEKWVKLQDTVESKRNEANILKNKNGVCL